MTDDERMLAKVRQAHQSALLSCQTMMEASVDHTPKYLTVTLGEFEVAAQRLENAGRLLRDAIAIRRATRPTAPAAEGTE